MKNALSMAMFSRRALSHQFAKEQITFLSDFADGLVRPDVCSEFEPIRTPFDQDDLSEPTSWLAKPHGSFLYKKGKPRIMQGEVWNLTHARDAPVPSPVFCTRWTARFDFSWFQKMGAGRLEAFVEQLFFVTESDFGLLTTESDLKAKNTNATSFSFKGLDLGEGIPGLYCKNFLSKELAQWLKIQNIPKKLATVEELENGGARLSFAASFDSARDPEVLRRQSETILCLGTEKFFNIHHPDRRLLTPNWTVPIRSYDEDSPLSRAD